MEPYERADVEIFSKYLLHIDEIVGSLENDLRGKSFDPVNGQWTQAGEPCMNEKGIQAIMSIVRSKVNRNTILQNLDEYQINSYARYIGYQVNDLLFLKYHEFELQKDNYDDVLWKVFDFCLFALQRAKNGETAKLIKDITSVNITPTQPPAEQKKGFYDYLKSMIGGGSQ